MFKRLRNRFLILYMGTVVLLLMLFFTAIYVFTFQGIEQKSNEMINRELNMRRLRISDIPPPERGINPKFSPVFTVEINPEKKVVNIISSFDMEEEFYNDITKEALSKYKQTDKIRYDNAYFKYKIVENRIVFLDVSKDEQMLENMIYIFWWIAIPMVLLIYLISLYFANKSIKPIETSYNKQKEFIADASHELKTPLATIETNVHVLLDGASSEQIKWLGYIKSQSERMSILIGSLLYLTKMDYKDMNESYEILDFTKLVGDYLMPLEAVFFENKISADFDIASDININGSSEQITRLVGILVDNAIKYTNGKIKISLEKVQNSARLTVYNTGVGIEKDELPKIWDRFYRGDKSRQYTGGFGLGLPIAKVIVDSHKGIITAESNVNEWTKFIVKIPLA